MSNLAGSALLASIEHRALALKQYADELPVVRGVGAESYAAAIAQVKRIAEAVQTQGSYELERAVNDQDSITRLRPLLQYLSETIDHVDQIFARGRDTVSTSLIRSVEGELKRLQIDEVHPLLAVGNPGNYETDPNDLWDSLYDSHILPGLRTHELGVRIFSIPPLEGTRSLWMPIAVGHEVAHIVVMDGGLIEQLGVMNWLSIDDIHAARIQPNNSMWPQTPEDILAAAKRFLREWTVEVLCDLYAVRRFGPAGIAAQCDFLASIAPEQEDQPGSHPPTVFRAEMMLGDETAKGTVFEPVIAAWRSWAEASRWLEKPGIDAILKTLRDHRQELIDILDRLPTPQYNINARNDVVRELLDWLRLGIPGRERAAGKQVTPEDLLNAGWIARSDDNQESANDRSARLDTLDKLVAKGLDTTDFLGLWHKYAAEYAVVKPSPDDAPSESPLKTNDGKEEPTGSDASASSDATTGGHAVLSEAELRRRLELGNQPRQSSENVKQRLIVTPDSTLVISGASMDVRIGRGFITFRRSSTATFDALSADQHPREMQELVEKDWGGEFVLHPGELVLAATLEFMMLPGDLTAQVVTRSSYGRLGLLSATAVQVQPKFAGCLTLELVNLGQMPLTLTPGERVAQLVFTRVYPPVETVETKYSFPTGPQFSKVSTDPDLEVLRRIHRNRVK